MRRNWRIRSGHSVISDINLTNLIDVTMTVLICYILIAPLVEQGIDVNLPQASPHKIEQREPITVNISKNGQIYLGNNQITLDQLKKQLKPEKGVIIKADKDVNYGTVIHVLDELNNAGITKVGMATQLKE